METTIEYFKNLYRDSVALMRISADLARRPGLEAASLLMGTPANMDLLVESGLTDTPPQASPGDIVMVVRGNPDAVREAVDAAQAALNHVEEHKGGDEAMAPASLLDAVDRARMSSGEIGSSGEKSEAWLALISTPGDFAGGEALKALRAGLHVMLFSDNVPVAQEVELKREAARRGLLVMGPDCGTAILNGVPLAFANVARHGDIGVVGASGTGTQQVVCLVDQLGFGITHAIGTGGHDLSVDVGGLTMLAGLAALAADEHTRVIMLVSKPPSDAVAETVLDAARACGKPVVINFLGRAIRDEGRVYGASTLEEAARRAVALSAGRPADFVSAGPDDPALNDRADALARGSGIRSSRRFLRGLYAGGTFCYEAQLLLRNLLDPLSSNTPVSGIHTLKSAWHSEGHTVLDLGDDAFTRGRPHPMIDPAPRNERLLQEALDPSVGLILLDVVLGYGSHPDPAGELAGAIRAAREAVAHAAGQANLVDAGPLFIASVCGTEADPQNLSVQQAVLEREGVQLCSSNAQAVMLALLTLRHAALRRNLAVAASIEGVSI